MAEDEIPSGGSMSPGPAQPVPAPPSLPSGNMLSSLGASPTLPSPGPSPMVASDPIGGIANAIQSTIGYATQDKALQQQAQQRETLRQQYQYTAAAHAGIMSAMDKLAAGDTQGARDVLKSNPAILFSQEGMALYGKTAELDRAIATHKTSVSVLASRGDVWSQLAGGILQSDPTMSTKDAMTQATDILKLNKVEKADDGFHIISPTGQQIGFIPAVKLMTQKRDESIVGVSGAPGSQPTVISGEKQPINYFHTTALSPDEKAALLRMKGFDSARYDMLARRAADNPEGDNKEFDTWNRIASLTAGMHKNPIDYQVAAAKLGITPEEAADPTIMPPYKAAQWKTEVDNQLADRNVREARGIYQYKRDTLTPAEVIPTLKGQVIFDPKTWQSRPVADLASMTEFDNLKAAGWRISDPKSMQQAQFATAALAGTDAADKLITRMYHDLGPGAQDMRISDAWKVWSGRHLATSEDVAAYRAIQVSLATEVGKAFNPQGRGSDNARKEIEDILPGGSHGFRLETLGTAKASMDVIRGELQNRRNSVTGLPLVDISLPKAQLQGLAKVVRNGKTYYSRNPSDPNPVWFEQSTPDVIDEATKK